MNEQKFFLYARKSTDVENKQVRSIEDQITELRAFAKLEKLEIVEELIEKQSAKIPGRPIFNSMIARIEQGEASGILSWNPDRLARNSVDGGKIIYLVDCGHLSFLKFPTFWFENTSHCAQTTQPTAGQKKQRSQSLWRTAEMQLWNGNHGGNTKRPYLLSLHEKIQNCKMC